MCGPWGLLLCRMGEGNCKSGVPWSGEDIASVTPCAIPEEPSCRCLLHPPEQCGRCSPGSCTCHSMGALTRSSGRPKVTVAPAWLLAALRLQESSLRGCLVSNTQPEPPGRDREGAPHHGKEGGLRTARSSCQNDETSPERAFPPRAGGTFRRRCTWRAGEARKTVSRMANAFQMPVWGTKA